MDVTDNRYFDIQFHMSDLCYSLHRHIKHPFHLKAILFNRLENWLHPPTASKLNPKTNRYQDELSNFQNLIKNLMCCSLVLRRYEQFAINIFFCEQTEKLFSLNSGSILVAYIGIEIHSINEFFHSG